MPLRQKDRLPSPSFNLLSTKKASPRGVIIGRHDESPRHLEQSQTPAPNNYQSVKQWGTDPNRPGPRIGTASINSGSHNPKIRYDPDSMLGQTLRSKNLDVPIYDPKPGIGDWNPRKGAAIMCGSHGKITNTAAGSHGGESFETTVEAGPGPLSYASDWGTIGAKAREKRVQALASRGACTFGGRWASKADNGVPGPGQYEQNFSKTMSPFSADESPRGLNFSAKSNALRNNQRNGGDDDDDDDGGRKNNSRQGTPRASSVADRKKLVNRPLTSQQSNGGLSPYQTDSSRGKSMAGRWKDPRRDTGPGPGEYTPILPFISAANSRVCTLKGRLPHPFVDTLAAHDCAKSDFNHSTRGASRMKARVTAV